MIGPLASARTLGSATDRRPLLLTIDKRAASGKIHRSAKDCATAAVHSAHQHRICGALAVAVDEASQFTQGLLIDVALELQSSTSPRPLASTATWSSGWSRASSARNVAVAAD